MTNEHASLEKYTSHTLFEMVAKGLGKGYVWEISWRRNKLQYIDLQFLCLWQHFFLVLLGCSIGVLLLSTASYLQLTYSKLTELPVAPGYIIVWYPPASWERRICTQFSPSTVKVIPWYLRSHAPVPWLTAGSKVNMWQYYRFLNCNTETLFGLVWFYGIPNIVRYLITKLGMSSGCND